MIPLYRTGYGAFTKFYIPKHGFVLEYPADLISVNEAEIREKGYAKQNAGCFMYYFDGKDTKSLW